ncbi:hypothetical protein JCM14469_43300 [Desulfatiferula olefinivorans]
MVKDNENEFFTECVHYKREVGSMLTGFLKMTRHPLVEIEPDTIQSFFLNAGQYPGKVLTDSQLSPIWKNVFNKFGDDIFTLFQDQKYDQLATAYANYYTNGISDGACAGKKLDSWVHRLKYTIRNELRIRKLINYSKFLLDWQKLSDTQLTKSFVDFLFDNYSIPEKILIGQPFGWQYGKNFLHAELIDHVYFGQFILSAINFTGTKSIAYLGDGSGLLSSFINSNCNEIKRKVYIDLAQYLFRQYIVNDVGENDKFLYAESFDAESFQGIDMLINQDSFPEIPESSLRNYFSLIHQGKIKYIFSYNQESCTHGHSDFRSILIENGMLSAFRTFSSLRKNYFIELFYNPEHKLA